MKIFKNFLNKEDFKKIQSVIMGEYMPWYYSDGVNEDEDMHDQFVFIFVAPGGVVNCTKPMLDLINPILSKIKGKKINKIKANLLLKTKKITQHGFHIDQTEGTTGIFYLNNCNGYTKFQTGEKIKSIENTYVEFNSTIKHTGTSCTDEKRRIVLNFNYK